ncbi:MAG: thiamine phosphate synthase, partial [bacterium]
MNQSLRMLDANLNRAREALRVMEDVARFCLQSEDLCGRLKSLRHEVAAVAAGVGAREVLGACGDPAGGVGSGLGSGEEEGRSGGVQGG